MVSYFNVNSQRVRKFFSQKTLADLANQKNFEKILNFCKNASSRISILAITGLDHFLENSFYHVEKLRSIKISANILYSYLHLCVARIK